MSSRLAYSTLAGLTVIALGAVTYFFFVGAFGWHLSEFYMGWVAASAYYAARDEWNHRSRSAT